MVGNHTVVGLLGDRPQVHEIDHTGPFLPSEGSLVHIVPDLGVDPLEIVLATEITEYLLELFTGQVAVAVGALDELIGIIHRPPAVKTHAHDGLGEDIQAVLGDTHAVYVPTMGCTAHDRTFDQIVRVEHQQPPLGHLSETVSAPTYPLETLGHRLGGTDLTYEIHGTDVYSQLKGR